MLPSVHTKGKMETPGGFAEQKMEELTQVAKDPQWI